MTLSLRRDFDLCRQFDYVDLDDWTTLDEAGEELAVLELEAEGLLAEVPDGLQLLRLGSISGFQDRREDDDIDCW